MAFFDEIKKQMSGVAQSAQKAAEIARLQHQVNVKQNEFDAIFAEIGQLYYDARKLGTQKTEEMDSLCARVDALAAEIEGLKLKLDELRQIRRCTVCGSVQNNESRFCASCGAKLPERVIKEEAPAAAPAEEEEVDDFKAAVQEELKKEYGTDDSGKTVYINWPETEKTEEEAPAAPAEEKE